MRTLRILKIRAKRPACTDGGGCCGREAGFDGPELEVGNGWWVSVEQVVMFTPDSTATLTPDQHLITNVSRESNFPA